jgi:hypothetical protein
MSSESSGNGLKGCNLGCVEVVEEIEVCVDAVFVREKVVEGLEYDETVDAVYDRENVDEGLEDAEAVDAVDMLLERAGVRVAAELCSDCI